MTLRELLRELRREAHHCFPPGLRIPTMARARLFSLITSLDSYAARRAQGGETMRYERWAASR